MNPIVINPDGSPQTVPLIKAIELYEQNNPNTRSRMYYAKRTPEERLQLRRDSQRRYRERKRERRE
jgi:hypothetical protein